MFITFLSSKIPGFSGNHLIILTFCVCPDSQDCKRMKHVTQLHCHVDVDFQQNPTTRLQPGNPEDEDHVHEEREVVEQRAVDEELSCFNTHEVCPAFNIKMLGVSKFPMDS